MMRILVVSPQPWNHVRISKHNYALTLAKLGHDVVFLNPPNDSIPRSSTEKITSPYPLTVLERRRPPFYRLRFHQRACYEWLLRGSLRRLLQRHALAFDSVWCFDFNSFADLNVFGASQKIFFPVDPLSDPSHLLAIRSADRVLTVSEKIAQQLRPSGKPVVVIGHGLAEPFARLAHERRRVACPAQLDSTRIRIGYAGNLARPEINHSVIEKIVRENTQVEFHFWGPCDSPSNRVQQFVNFLVHSRNVTLHGAVSQESLVDGFRTMDVFLLSYRSDSKEYDRSNSHKILEYLSTGRVVVSSLIDHFSRDRELLVMPETESDDSLPRLFRQTIQTLSSKNSAALQQARLKVALGSTYESHVRRILRMSEEGYRPTAHDEVTV